ncbi:MAG TPA: TonB-dependent receptor plug domain-containing protein, partial [Caulobacteraceae bacterium]|nr:TonB-dependent receptor plug domain-containing protein [Caulobacteraceae bacterium]
MTCPTSRFAARTLLLACCSALTLGAAAARAADDAAAAPATPTTAPASAKPAAKSATPSAKSSATNNVSEVVVTASRVDLLGIADTASQGTVTQKEMELRPVYRVGQLLETTPGLVVTVHSGEGKAQQYLLRGFNLDHG